MANLPTAFSEQPRCLDLLLKNGSQAS